jgi:hypothetical protein
MTIRTKDEIFMIKLYEEACKKPEMDEPFDRYEIGKLAGLQERAVNAITNLLIRSMFVKKKSETEIAITDHGVKLVLSILENE